MQVGKKGTYVNFPMNKSGVLGRISVKKGTLHTTTQANIIIMMILKKNKNYFVSPNYKNAVMKCLELPFYGLLWFFLV